MESNKETRKRLTAVLNALKKEGHTQAKIADELGINADNISSYKIGKTKEIPDAFLDGLQEKYFINPGYIRGTSELMYDMQGFRLTHFEKFADSWETVEQPVRSDAGEIEFEKFICLTMDKNFCDFLIEAEKAHDRANEGIGDEQEDLKNLSVTYSGESKPQEYILIPRNNFSEMVEEFKRKKRTLEEVLDFSMFDVDEEE